MIRILSEKPQYSAFLPYFQTCLKDQYTFRQIFAHNHTEREQEGVKEACCVMLLLMLLDAHTISMLKMKF